MRSRLHLVGFLLLISIVLEAKTLSPTVEKEYIQLHRYILNYDYKSFKFFLNQHNTNPNIYNIYSPTLLETSAKKNRLKFVKLLIEKGVNVNFRTRVKNSTAIHIAIDEKSYKVANYLIYKTKNINIQDRDGNTLLHLAVKNSANEIIKLLLDKGASKVIQNNQGHTPYDLAQKNLAIDINVLPLLSPSRKKEQGSKIHKKLKINKIQTKFENSKIINRLKNSKINDRLKSSKRINVYDKSYVEDNVYIGK